MSNPRYLRAIQVVANRELVERFRGGFVGKFDRDVLWLTLAYEAYLERRVVTEGIPKLFITWTDQPVEPTNKPSSPMAIKSQFPFDQYRIANLAAKKQLLADRLHVDLLNAASDYGWDPVPFEEARERLIRCHLTPRLLANKTYRHPRLRLKAQLSCELDLDEFRISCAIVDLQSRSLGESILAGTAVPTHDPFGSYLQGTHWNQDDTLELRGSSFHQTAFQVNFRPQLSLRHRRP
jgi:hypothetical protein